MTDRIKADVADVLRARVAVATRLKKYGPYMHPDELSRTVLLLERADCALCDAELLTNPKLQ